MTQDLLRTLMQYLQVFQPVLTRPGFANMAVIFAGWVLTNGTHAITQALVETGVAGKQHHEAFHRFFSRGTWNPDELGRVLFERLLTWLPKEAPIRIAIDDTLAPKKGPNVFGIGSHIDAVRSTKLCKIFCFGHCWVMLAVLVSVPFSRRPWALPILFRLYRNKKECAKKNEPYRKKTELAREMLAVFVRWTGGRRVELACDSAYCNNTVTRTMPQNVVLFGAMRPDAVLTTTPPERKPGQKGRHRKRGKLLPKPQDIARDGSQPWNSCKAELYGSTQTVYYKELCAQWYRACGIQLVRLIIVKVENGTIPFRVFFCTDIAMSVVQILEGYAGRWSIEVCFRNLKQLLGFADSSARKKAAVERTAPFVGFAYTLLVMWFVQHARKSTLATPPVRPWYGHKQGLSFADVLRTAQRVLVTQNILVSSRGFNNLYKSSRRPRRAAKPRRGLVPARPRRCAA